MVPERLRRALEPFEPVYTPQDDGSTHVHIPGAEYEWMFHERTPGNTLVESRFVGRGAWERAGDMTGAVRQVADDTINSEYNLERAVHGLVWGEKEHQLKVPHQYRVRVRQNSVHLGGDRFEKQVSTHLVINNQNRHSLTTHPDHTALTADPMPERIQDGANSVLQGHMPPEVLIDELLDHHEAHPQQFARLVHYSRSYNEALRRTMERTDTGDLTALHDLAASLREQKVGGANLAAEGALQAGFDPRDPQYGDLVETTALANNESRNPEKAGIDVYTDRTSPSKRRLTGLIPFSSGVSLYPRTTTKGITHLFVQHRGVLDPTEVGYYVRVRDANHLDHLLADFTSPVDEWAKEEVRNRLARHLGDHPQPGWSPTHYKREFARSFARAVRVCNGS